MRNMSISDDLKSNFRSWETDNDNSESLHQLASIIVDRHGIDYEEALIKSANWIGYEEPVEEKSFLKNIVEQ